MNKTSKKLSKKIDYISLREATKYCPYSQEYLSLRARQGKLKAIKIGRNWVTTKEWINEYLRRFNNIEKEKTETEKLSLDCQDLSASYLFCKSEERKNIKHLLFLGVSIIILLLGLVFLIAGPQKNYKSDTYSLTGDIIISKEMLFSLTFSDFQRSLVENFKDYSNWVRKKISNAAVVFNYKYITFKERLSYLSLKLFKKEIPQESVKISETATKAQERAGAIIFSHPQEAEAKEKIADAFSDKVKIEPQDENSGIIVPVFRTKKEEKYFYIMVPVKEQ